MHRFSRLPSQASARSPRDDLAGCPGTLQIRQHPSLEDPMRHRILRVFGLDRRFWAFTSAATRADTHTSRRCGVSLSRYHGHRSTRSDPQSAAASILLTIPLAIAARSCTVNIRRTNNPSRQALLLRPYDTADPFDVPLPGWCRIQAITPGATGVCRKPRNTVKNSPFL